MGKMITAGKGRIIENIITDFENFKGFVHVNGRLDCIKSFNKEANTITVNEDVEILINAKTRVTKFDVQIIETNDEFEPTVLPLKSSQWHHAYKQLNRIVPIEIVELKNKTLVAKTPIPEHIKQNNASEKKSFSKKRE